MEHKRYSRRIKGIKIFHFLSLDVVFGAISGGIMASRLLEMEMSWDWWVIMPLTVWFVYLLDHFIDGLKLMGNAYSIRYYFHYYHRKKLLALIVFIFLTGGVITYGFLERILVFFGMGMFILIGIYFVLVNHKTLGKKLFFQKEVITALIYTFGIWGGPILMKGFFLEVHQWAVIFTFYLIALADLLIFSIIDYEIEVLDKQSTMLREIGVKGGMKGVKVIMAIAAFVSMYLLVTGDHVYKLAASVFFVMLLGLTFLIRNRMNFKNSIIHRVVGESLFILPSVFLLV